MVNLDEVRTSDTLVVEVPVLVYSSGTIEFQYGIVRHEHDEPSGKIKVLGHKPRAIDEPTGIGAVVRATDVLTGVTHVLVNTGIPDFPWVSKSNGKRYSWKEVTRFSNNVQVISTGLEQEIED